MHPSLIQTPKALEEGLKLLGNPKFIAVDTEFIRETTFFPKIALIQLANDKNVILIDPLAFKNQELEGLHRLLKDPAVLKIMHASYADQECFYYSYGYVAEPVLDTAAAAALLGLGDNIGLSKLLKEVLDIHVPKGRSRVKWLERPLATELLEYAELDVRYLVRLGTTLLKKLEEKKRKEWVLELSQISMDAFDESPEKMAERLGRNVHWGDKHGINILTELVRWREARARELNIPRHWLCDNDVLQSLAKVKPKTANELKTFRGLGAKEIDKSAEKILNAIQTGLRVPLALETKSEDRRPRGNTEQDPVKDLVQTYIYYLASDLEIAPRHLLTQEQTARLVDHSDKNIEEWISRKIISHRAADLVGTQLKELLQGRKGLIIKNRRLTLFDVPSS